MNVVVHMPETGAGIQELARRVAAVHAIAVKHQLDNAVCSRAEKLNLIQAVQDSLADNT